MYKIFRDICQNSLIIRWICQESDDLIPYIAEKKIEEAFAVRFGGEMIS